MSLKERVYSILIVSATDAFNSAFGCKMSLKERVYSILIVSATDAFNSAFADLLPETRYSPVHTVSSINAARCTLTEKTYDFVIINAPLRDDMGVRFAIDTCSNKQSVVLLLVKSDIHNGIHDQVTEYGASMIRLQNMVYLPCQNQYRKQLWHMRLTGWKAPGNG